MARVGILGGTFDPIHYGHLIIAEAALDQLRLDRVEFLPANDPPHKPEGSVSTPRHRVAMVEAAIRSVDYFALNCIEMEREGPSYTADTLTQLAQSRPDDQFWFIIGGDSLRDLPSWRSPARILDVATLAIIERPGAVYDLDGLDRLIPGLRQRVAPVDAPLIDLSATLLRKRFAAGGSIRFQTPDSVITYMIANNLYR